LGNYSQDLDPFSGKNNDVRPQIINKNSDFGWCESLTHPANERSVDKQKRAAVVSAAPLLMEINLFLVFR
jgi:hypothetical protein